MLTWYLDFFSHCLGESVANKIEGTPILKLAMVKIVEKSKKIVEKKNSSKKFAQNLKNSKKA